MDRFDEKFAAPDLVPDVILDFVPVTFFRHDVFIGVADTQMGNLFSVQDDLVFAVDLLDCDVWNDIIFRGLGENCARSRLELCDVVRAFLDLFDRNTHATCDFGETAFTQIRHVFGDDLIFEAISFSRAFQLNEQTLLQISCADARRIKALDQRQHVLKIFLRNPGVQGHFFRGGL